MISLVLAAVVAASPLPADPNPTLGVLNPDVTDATIDQTICKSGWTAMVRPPASFTDKLKVAQLPSGADPHAWEEDHVMPLEVGGAPRDPHNLRPQFWTGPDGARAKDHQAENVAHKAVCAHTITLEQGQAVIRAWITAHHPFPVPQAGSPQ